MLELENVAIFKSPMEQFEIYPLFNLNLILPNPIFFYFIASVIIILIISVGTIKKNSQIPNTFGLIHELLFRSILLMVDTYMVTIYFPLIYSLFHIIFISNIIGMVPYSSTPTVEIVITQSLAFTMQIGVLIIGILSHKLYLLAAFLPAGIPIFLIPAMIPLEIFAYFTRTFSQGLRLAVNMITGHILVKVCLNFIWVAYLNNTSFIVLIIPIFLIILFLALELLIAYLQAYIFTFITCLTFKDMTYYNQPSIII